MEKVFQISAEVPEMPEALKTRFWRKLLQTQTSDLAADTAAAEAQVGTLQTEEDILKAVAAVDPRKEPIRAKALRDAAMRRLAEPELLKNLSHHVLEVFEERNRG